MRALDRNIAICPFKDELEESEFSFGWSKGEKAHTGDLAFGFLTFYPPICIFRGAL